MHPAWFDRLRCPEPHATSPLIVAATRRAGADVLDGSLGCPTCGATYVLRDGRVAFGRADPTVVRGPGVIPSDDDVMRLAAQLDLVTPGRAVVLGPAWAEHAPPLAVLVDPLLLLVDPPPGMQVGDGIAAIDGAPRPPLGDGTLHGVALDAALASAGGADAWVAAVRGGGRVVGPAGMPVPAGVRELARDERHWVGTRVAATSAPIALSRRPAS